MYCEYVIFMWVYTEYTLSWERVNKYFACMTLILIYIDCSEGSAKISASWVLFLQGPVIFVLFIPWLQAVPWYRSPVSQLGTIFSNKFLVKERDKISISEYPFWRNKGCFPRTFHKQFLYDLELRITHWLLCFKLQSGVDRMLSQFLIGFGIIATPSVPDHLWSTMIIPPWPGALDDEVCRLNHIDDTSDLLIIEHSIQLCSKGCHW